MLMAITQEIVMLLKSQAKPCKGYKVFLLSGVIVLINVA